MLTALILICSMTATPDLALCGTENAESVIRLPQDDITPVSCLMHGQAYVAETEIGRNLDAGERVKVVCTKNTRPTQSVSAVRGGRTVP